jgi:hypothetical protein
VLELAARIFLIGCNEHEIDIRTFVAVTLDERSADEQGAAARIIFETIGQPIDRALMMRIQLHATLLRGTTLQSGARYVSRRRIDAHCLGVLFHGFQILSHDEQS